MHSLLIISLFNLDLRALVFQSAWSIRIEASLKCVAPNVEEDRPLSEGKNEYLCPATLRERRASLCSAFSLPDMQFSEKLRRINSAVISALETNKTQDKSPNFS